MRRKLLFGLGRNSVCSWLNVQYYTINSTRFFFRLCFVFFFFFAAQIRNMRDDSLLSTLVQVSSRQHKTALLVVVAEVMNVVDPPYSSQRTWSQLADSFLASSFIMQGAHREVCGPTVVVVGQYKRLNLSTVRHHPLSAFWGTKLPHGGCVMTVEVPTITPESVYSTQHVFMCRAV